MGVDQPERMPSGTANPANAAHCGSPATSGTVTGPRVDTARQHGPWSGWTAIPVARWYDSGRLGATACRNTLPVSSSR